MSKPAVANREILEHSQQVFEKLARKERHQSPPIKLPRDPWDTNNPYDRWQRVYVSLSENHEGSDTAQFTYHLSAGLDDHFRARYIEAATKAGKALGFSRKEALEKFLALVVQDAIERRSKWWHKQSQSLWLPTNGGTGRRIDVNAIGWLDCLCLESATACIRFREQVPELRAVIKERKKRTRPEMKPNPKWDRITRLVWESWDYSLAKFCAFMHKQYPASPLQQWKEWWEDWPKAYEDPYHRTLVTKFRSGIKDKISKEAMQG